MVDARPAPAPYFQPLLKCPKPTGDPPLPVYISGNLEGGILAEGPSLTLANTIVGLKLDDTKAAMNKAPAPGICLNG